MAVNCMICNAGFKEDNTDLIVCNHHEAPVHLKCCINSCSWDRQPCIHSQGTFTRLG